MSSNWEVKEQHRLEEMESTKNLIVATMERITTLLENGAEHNIYGGSYNSASELFNKLHELRRDSIRLEMYARRKY